MKETWTQSEVFTCLRLLPGRAMSHTSLVWEARTRLFSAQHCQTSVECIEGRREESHACHRVDDSQWRGCSDRAGTPWGVALQETLADEPRKGVSQTAGRTLVPGTGDQCSKAAGLLTPRARDQGESRPGRMPRVAQESGWKLER